MLARISTPLRYVIALIQLAPFLAVCSRAPAQSTFHANLSRTGAYSTAGPREFKGVKWLFHTDAAIVGSPAVSNGLVFIGSTDGNMYAVDEETGKQKWVFKTPSAITSSPAVEDGVVYFENFDGRFFAVAADTGARKWAFATDGEHRFEAKGLHGMGPEQQTVADPWDFFLSSPAVFQGTVYFGSGDGNVYALDAKTGYLLWKFPTGSVVHSSPAVYGSTLYIGSWDTYLYALDAASGIEKWRFKTGEDPVSFNQTGIQSSPAVADGIVYFGCRDAHIYAVDAATGRKKWDYSTSKSWTSATPAVANGVVYVGTSDSKLFHALDAKTGRHRFTVRFPAHIFSSAAVAGGVAYFGALNGYFYAIDVSTGNQLWQFQTESSKGDALKVLNADGSWNPTGLHPIFHDYQDMTINMFRRFSVGSILSSPVVDRGMVIFGSTDGNLYALF